MKFNLLIFLLLLLQCYSCRNSATKPIRSTSKSLAATPTINKPPSTFSDTIKIGFPSAVFFSPDTLQLEKIKAITPAIDFENETHNCFYLFHNARNVLKKDWPQVHINEISRARWLCFTRKDKSKLYIDLDRKGDMCGILLFDGGKEPEMADMMNIETSLGFYFAR